MKMLKTTLAVLTAAAALGAVSNAQAGATPVSYTHLTLPTNSRV